jgi:O-antigen/teichoic acid export membrane protein
MFSRTISNIIINFTGTAIVGVILVIFNILAFRWLGAANFGILSIASTIAVIGFDILSLGTSQALVRFVSVYLGQNKTAAASSTASIILRFRVIQGLLVILLAMPLARILSINFFHKPELTQPVFIGLLTTTIYLLSDFFTVLLQAREKFITRSLVLTLNGLARLLALSLFFIIGWHSVVALLIAFAAGPLINGLVGYLVSPRQFITTPPNPAITQSIIKFSKWMGLWGLTASLASRLDIILLGKFTSAYDAGIYAAAAKLASAFILGQGAINAVLEPKTARLVHNQFLLKRNFLKISLGLTVVILGLILLIPTAPRFIPLILGPQAQASVALFQVLMIGIIFFVATTPSMVTLMATGHSRAIGLLSLSQLAISLFLYLWLIPPLKAVGAAITVSSSYFITFVAATVIALKLIQPHNDS